MANIALIPARSGSTRIPNKNIRFFRGKPIIEYAIEALIASNCFDEIFVSTDSTEIAEVALNIGAKIPFKRNSYLSTNETATIDVVVDAINNLSSLKIDNLCCVYATNPLLQPEFLNLGLKILKTTPNCNYVTTITRYGFPIQRSLLTKTDGLLEMTWPENMYKHSQSLEARYHETGQFWWASKDTWLSKAGMQTKVYGIELPSWIQQDIDELDDWYLAEAKYDFLKTNPKLLASTILRTTSSLDLSP